MGTALTSRIGSKVSRRFILPDGPVVTWVRGLCQIGVAYASACSLVAKAAFFQLQMTSSVAPSRFVWVLKIVELLAY